MAVNDEADQTVLHIAQRGVDDEHPEFYSGVEASSSSGNPAPGGSHGGGEDHAVANARNIGHWKRLEEFYEDHPVRAPGPWREYDFRHFDKKNDQA